MGIEQAIKNPKRFTSVSAGIVKDKRISLVRFDLPEVEIPKEDGYHRNGKGANFVRSLLAPTLNIIPGLLGSRQTQKIIASSGEDAREVIENVTSAKACNVLYRRAGNKIKGASPIENWVFNIDNARAMPNRLRVVRKELIASLEYLAKEFPGQTLKVASIAAGSARAMLEAVKQAQLPSDTKIDLLLADASKEALDASRELAGQLAIPHNVNYRRAIVSPRFFKREFPNGGVHLFEMVGLGDYFTDPGILEVNNAMQEALTPKGVLVTGNILPNREKPFVVKAVGWSNMFYRSSRQMGQLIANAGFDPRNIRLIEEPLKVHGVVVARK